MGSDDNIMIQVGVIGYLRDADGIPQKTVPLYRPITPEEAMHVHDADDDFARIAFERMKAVVSRLHIKL